MWARTHASVSSSSLASLCIARVSTVASWRTRSVPSSTSVCAIDSTRQTSPLIPEFTSARSRNASVGSAVTRCCNLLMLIPGRCTSASSASAPVELTIRPPRLSTSGLAKKYPANRSNPCATHIRKSRRSSTFSAIRIARGAADRSALHRRFELRRCRRR